MTETDAKPTIAEALALVMGEVQSVGKTGRNTQQNYNFRGVDAVVNAVGPAMRLYGVVCVPISVEHRFEHYETRSGASMKNVTVLVGFRFYGPSGDHIDTFASGEAADAGDKATPKAHSVAYRTMLLQALCIPTDEPDPDQEAHERAAAPPPVRVDGPQQYPIPTSWPKVKDAFRDCDNADESEALYEAFLQSAVHHQYGKLSLKDISSDERKVMLQKAAGAVCWLHDTDVGVDGPFVHFLEKHHRAAWHSVLGGADLQIPDYVPPEPATSAEAEAESYDEEAARMAAESFAETGKDDA